MRIKDLKIGQKILIGLIVLFLICSAIGYVGYSKMAIVTDRVDKGDDANRLIIYAQELRYIVKDFIFSGNKEDITEWEKTMALVLSQIDSTRTKFKQEKNYEFMCKLEEKAVQYHRFFDRYIELSNQVDKLNIEMIETGRVVIGSTDSKSKYYGGAKLSGENIIVEAILNARRHEKNFIIRENDIYIEKVHKEIDLILLSTSNKKIITATNNYREAFNNYIDIYHQQKKLEAEIYETEYRFIEYAVTIRNSQRDQMLDAKEAANVMIILFTSIAVFLGLAIALFITRLITKPLKQIIKKITAIAQGDLEQEIDIDSNDEIGELANAYRKMQKSLLEITGKARIVAKGDLNVQVDVRSQKDELAISLNEMAKSLQESDEFAKAILNSTQAGVVLIDAETHIIEYINPVAEEMIGAKKERITGKICYELICTATEGQCPITDKGETIYNEEKILLTAKGEKIPVLNTVRSIDIGNKNLLIETFVDISNLKQAELTAKRNEENFRRLFEQSNDAIFIHTITDEKILNVNEMACKLTGYSKNELLSMSTFDLRPDNIKTEVHNDSTKMRDKESLFIETVFQRADGALIDVEISAKVIDKELDIAQGIVRDITERKQFEKELKERNDEIEKQNRIKSGQNELNEKMRGEQDVSSLSGNIIKYISKYSGANIGGFYILNEKGDELNLSGSYAYSKYKNTKRKIKIGEGLLGQAAIEKEMMIIKDLPEDYLHINSVLGDAVPLSAIILPFILDNKVVGVIELGAFKEFSETEIEFLQSVTENIAIGINSAKIRAKMKETADRK